MYPGAAHHHQPPQFPPPPGSGYGPPPGVPPGGPGGYGGYAPPPGQPGGGYGFTPPPSGFGPPGPGGYGPPPPGGSPAPGPGYNPSYAPPPPQGPQGPGTGPGGYGGGGGGYGGYGPPPGGPGGPPGPGGYNPGYASPPPPPNYGGPGGYGPPPPQGPPQGPPPGGYGGGGYGYNNPMGPPHMPPQEMQNYGPQFQGPGNQMQQPFFQYSQCNGKKKALCIGINYIGQTGELRGCHNDALNVKNFLCRQYGYHPEDIVLLLDNSPNPRERPTRQNIVHAMQWLVSNAHPNDSLFFHYSGHGGQTKDLDGDEADGFDEVIYPVDYEEAGHLVDDDMYEIMVRQLPPGCRLTAIFDSCHSGSALDLPYIYSTEGKIKEPNLAAEAGQGLLTTGMAYMRGDMGAVFSGVSGLLKTATGSNKKADDYAKATRTSPADVISWSGCKDSQTSADTQEAGQATGAMSWAFIEALSANPNQSYQQLLNNLRDLLRAKYSQKPQLSSSHPMDTSIFFIA